MKKVKLIALLAAAVAALCIYAFLREIGKPQETPRTEVVVAAVDIPENTKITEEMLLLQPVADEALLPGHMLDPESVIGNVLSGDVFAGEQIIRERLVQVGTEVDESKTLAYKVDDGMRAITIPVTNVTGLSNMIKPGNCVDIIMSYYQTVEETETERETDDMETQILNETESAEPEIIRRSRLQFQNLKILAVDAELTKNGLEAYVTVTLQVTPETAVEIAHAVAEGTSLYLIMRSTLDDEILEVIDVDMDTLLGLEEEGGK